RWGRGRRDSPVAASRSVCCRCVESRHRPGVISLDGTADARTMACMPPLSCPPYRAGRGTPAEHQRDEPTVASSDCQVHRTGWLLNRVTQSTPARQTQFKSLARRKDDVTQPDPCWTGAEYATDRSAGTAVQR